MFWRFDALLGLLLKTVQHIDSLVDLHRVHSPIGVAQVILDHFEDASPGALAAYRAAGLPGDIGQLRADPDTLQRWTRLKSRALVDFTAELTERVRAVRGPQIKTARNIFAMPILERTKDIMGLLRTRG